ncbi:hypothetical protein OH77DRAFT_1370723, partial [Trametes cingulata]
LRKQWTSPVYALNKTEISIEYQNGRRSHVFTCAQPTCNYTLCRYIDTKGRSTGNMKKHVLQCWGKEAVKRAMDSADDTEARKDVVESILSTCRINAYFGRKKKGAVTYSHMQHTRKETRAELTGRQGYYIPSPSTVSRDANMVFARTREHIARMLQEYEGRLSFATDTWTSPNHHSFIAITAHLEVEGQPMRLLLDLVEVTKSHTGLNLAAAF